MTSNGKDQTRTGSELGADRPELQRDIESQPPAQSDMDDETSGLLGFVRWAADDDAPVTDAQADYVLRMTADIVVQPERLARIRARVLSPESLDGSVPHAVTAAATGRPPDGSPPFEQIAIAPTLEETNPHIEPAASATVLRRPGAGRPSFWRRCRELKRKMDDVLAQLHLTHEILLELEQERPEREAKQAAYLAAREAERQANEAEAIAREEARLAVLAQRRYVGEIGERIRLTARAERVVRLENGGYMGGTRYLVRFRDEQENSLVCWTERLPFAIDREGDPLPPFRVVSLVGTVKSHNRYNDEPQTIIQRVKCEPVQGAPP